MSLPPLDDEGVLWLAAMDLVPIEDRVEWVKRMKEQLDGINDYRATLPARQITEVSEFFYYGPVTLRARF